MYASRRKLGELQNYRLICDKIKPYKFRQEAGVHCYNFLNLVYQLSKLIVWIGRQYKLDESLW